MPHGFARFSLYSVSALASLSQAQSLAGHTPQGETIVIGKMAQDIDEVGRAAANLGYSGVVLVAHRGKILLANGYGWADRERGVPFQSDTRFSLASIDKTFTAAAILELQEQRTLSVTDAMSKYIPNWPAAMSRVTIHDVLVHASGLPLDVAPDEEMLTRQELLRRVAELKPSSKPGEKWAYSNLGYSLLAVIVELVSKEPFGTFLNRNLFKPAGLIHTRYPSPTEAKERDYCGYRSFLSKCIPASTRLLDDGGPSWSLRGGAGLLSSTQDLFRWHEALKAETPLSAESQRLATTPYIKTTLKGSMGYGWFIETDARRGKVVSHSGGNGVIATNYRRYLDTDIVLIEFTNNSRGGAYRYVSNALEKISLGEPVAKIPKATFAVSKSQLKRFTGTYRLPSGDCFEVAVQNGQLYVPLSSPAIVRWISSQPSLANEALEREAEDTVEAVLRGIASSDYEPLRKSLPEGVNFKEEQRFWSDHWPRLSQGDGAFKKIVTIASAMNKSALNSASEVPEVRLLAVYEHGLQYFEAQKVGGGWYVNVTNNAPLPPGGYRFVPTGPGVFQSYLFPSSEHLSLKFVGRDGQRVLIRNSTRETLAVKGRCLGN